MKKFEYHSFKTPTDLLPCKLLQALGLNGWQFVSKIDRIDEKGEIFYELIMMRELNQEDNNENLLDKARELRFMRKVLEYITQTQTKNV